MRVHIAPTYRCNLSCWYCYASPFGANFPGELTFEQYRFLVDHLLTQGLTSVSFLGGEPTLWSPLSDAMAYAEGLGLKRLLYTNGAHLRCAPEIVVYNGTPALSGGGGDSTRRSLEWYRSNGSTLVLRLNISRQSDEEQIATAIKLALILDAQISLAVLDATPKDQVFGAQIYRICSRFLDASVSVQVSRPLPLCMLTEGQQALLKEKCALRGVCNLETAVPVINPDGASVFPCNSVPLAFPLSYIYERRVYLSALPPVDATPPGMAPCRDCDLFRQGHCQNGCLGRWLPAAAARQATKSEFPSCEVD